MSVSSVTEANQTGNELLLGTFISLLLPTGGTHLLYLSLFPLLLLHLLPHLLLGGLFDCYHNLLSERKGAEEHVVPVQTIKLNQAETGRITRRTLTLNETTNHLTAPSTWSLVAECRL